jgi:hypothetical protein
MSKSNPLANQKEKPMALTKKLKRTGEARRIELADERELLESIPPVDPVLCTVCGKVVEDRPMRPGLCYDCYRDAVQAIQDELLTVRQDGSVYSAEITMSLGNDGRLGLGPIWSPETFSAGEDYDATPCPPQPVINFDDVEEIQF